MGNLCGGLNYITVQGLNSGVTNVITVNVKRPQVVMTQLTNVVEDLDEGLNGGLDNNGGGGEY